MTLIKIFAGIVCFASMMHPALADYGSDGSSSAPPSSTSGYSSSASAPPSTTGGYSSSAPPSSDGGYSSSASPATTPKENKHKKHNRFSFSVNLPASNTVVTYHGPKHGGAHHLSQQPFWIAMHHGEPIPANAVVGGSQYNPNATFFVCRANYHGGVHPGKFYRGNCNISWGSREITLQSYEILLSDTPMSWIETSNGAIPHHAIPGGYENNNTLYICQADYENGTHPGKIIGNNCNFGWGGREMSTPYYNVLVG